ncbi:caspase family protein, partial [Methylomonas sp. SURF-1]
SPLGELNRIQPEVKILRVRQGATSDQVEVDVEVVAKEDSTQKNGKTRTDAYDLRLFRDGQLVGQWPEPKSETKGVEELEAWRAASRVPMAKDATKTTHTFPVRLASRDQGRAVKFTAYAFNEDRVKSGTAEDGSYKVPADIPRRQPRAYVLTVGVDSYDEPKRKLDFAVKDGQALAAALSHLKDYEVVKVSLLSGMASEPQVTQDGASSALPVNQAIKANIRAILELLAGKGEAERERLKGLVGIDRQAIEQLKKATPDDVVILAFSGHGYTESNGRFYLLPSDSGTAKAIREDLPKFISSEELTEWLREVDAGELAMVIDACHSAASVDTPGFKPGPMGDRGLGQLAYDKGMRILAATQANDVAIEADKLGHGLFTYALVKDGLKPKADKKRQADLDNDGKVTLAEWLQYGEKRVPGAV